MGAGHSKAPARPRGPEGQRRAQPPIAAANPPPTRHVDPSPAAVNGNRASGSSRASPSPVPSPMKLQQQPNGTQPLSIAGSGGSNAGGGMGSGTFPPSASIPTSSSVPRYVDGHSMVFGSPYPANDGTNLSSHNGLGASMNSRSLDGAPSSQPRLTQGTNDFMLGQPATPLSPSRRHLPPLSQAAATTPIAIPTYNSVNEDVGTCASPMLKSYRQHSLSASKGTLTRDFIASPTSPKLVFSGSNPGAFSLGNTQGNISDYASCPTALTLMSSQGPSASAEHGGGAEVPIHQRFLEITGYPLGLENFGNTCYCNSVIQLLYHCPPLRLRLLELHDIYHSKKGGAGFEENTLLYHLSSLMAVMHKSNNRKKDAKKRELISPAALLKAVKEKNAAFNNDMQQDAHEFAMYILNDIMETESKMMTDPKNRALFAEESKKKKGSAGLAFWRGGGAAKDGAVSRKLGNDAFMLPPAAQDGASSGKRLSKDAGRNIKVPDMSPLQSILQGQFGSMTACLECGHISARDEVFIDLSLETEQGSSLLTCLRHFGDPEYFYGDNRLRCDHCKDKARAAKTIHVQHLPGYALLVHLKRFRYDVSKQTFTKKADHVALPMTMDVEEYLTDPNELESEGTASAAPERRGGAADSYYATHREVFKPADEATKRRLRGVAKHKARYSLSGFVAHLGEGPSLGHYFTCVRYGPQQWRRFDDDAVSLMTEREVQQYFGVPINLSGVVTTTAYILLYERVA